MNEELVAANQAFYDAFRRGDVQAMDALWATRAEVVCVHPGRMPLRGRERVMASWRAILSSGAQRVLAEDARAYPMVEGGFVTCEERLPGVRLSATNVFVREDGRLRIIHHQSGVIEEPRSPSVPPSALN